MRHEDPDLLSHGIREAGAVTCDGFRAFGLNSHAVGEASKGLGRQDVYSKQLFSCWGSGGRGGSEMFEAPVSDTFGPLMPFMRHLHSRSFVCCIFGRGRGRRMPSNRRRSWTAA